MNEQQRAILYRYKLARSREDYVAAVQLAATGVARVRAVDIRRQLGFNAASVSIALPKLAEEGYLARETGCRDIRLTPQGETLANAVLARRRFFTARLTAAGVDEANALNEAHLLEHVLPDESFALLSRSGRLTGPASETPPPCAPDSLPLPAEEILAVIAGAWPRLVTAAQIAAAANYTKPMVSLTLSDLQGMDLLIFEPHHGVRPTERGLARGQWVLCKEQAIRAALASAGIDGEAGRLAAMAMQHLLSDDSWLRLARESAARA